MSMFGNTPPQTTDPMELFEYFMEQKRQKSLPKGEQSEGIFNKPIQDSASGALDFFTDMYEKITSKSQQAKEELQPDMEELARQSAEEAALYRMEAGIKESLAEPYRKPTSDLAEGTSLRPMMREDIVSLGEPEGDETLPDTPEVTTTELKPAKDGSLMSKKLEGKDGDLDFDQDFTNNFVELMGKREGTEDHTASEGQFTYAYGILPATARSLGIDPENYSSRKDFAKAVYGRMHQDAKEDYADVFNNMSGKDQQSVMSLYINLGRLPSGVVDALSGPEKDFASAADSLKGVIHYTNRNTNTTYSSKGLSKRRAQEYNSLMEGREGFRKVTTVAVEGSERNPEYVWYDENNEEVKRFASSHPLSPDNSMSPIAVPN